MTIVICAVISIRNIYEFIRNVTVRAGVDQGNDLFPFAVRALPQCAFREFHAVRNRICNNDSRHIGLSLVFRIGFRFTCFCAISFLIDAEHDIFRDILLTDILLEYFDAGVLFFFGIELHNINAFIAHGCKFNFGKNFRKIRVCCDHYPVLRIVRDLGNRTRKFSSGASRIDITDDSRFHLFFGHCFFRFRFCRFCIFCFILLRLFLAFSGLVFIECFHRHSFFTILFINL